MRNTYIISIAVGVGVLLLTQWAWIEGIGRLYVAAGMNAPEWYGAAVNVLFAVAMVLPGFCSGWIAKRRGILCGLLTGLIGGLAYATVLSPILHHLNLLRFYERWPVISAAFWSSQFGLALTCAAGGATGELLCSNFRPRGHATSASLNVDGDR